MTVGRLTEQQKAFLRANAIHRKASISWDEAVKARDNLVEGLEYLQDNRRPTSIPEDGMSSDGRGAKSVSDPYELVTAHDISRLEFDPMFVSRNDGVSIFWGGYDYFLKYSGVNSKAKILNMVAHIAQKEWKDMTGLRINLLIKHLCEKANQRLSFDE